jgi:hypothetical protein
LTDGQVDPSATGDQPGGIRNDLFDAMKTLPRGAGHDDRVATAEDNSLDGIVSGMPSDDEPPVVSE